MSAIFYAPFERDDEIEIAVEDPGYGRMIIRRPDDGSWIELSGHGLGRALDALTERATADTDDLYLTLTPVRGLWPMSRRQAGRLLPQMQRAVILATAGTDRAELVDVSDEYDAGVICVHCAEGAMWAAANPNPNPWCEEHGHTPFGTFDTGGKTAWDRAQARHERRRAMRVV